MKEQLPASVEAVKEQAKGKFIGTGASGYGCAMCGWAYQLRNGNKHKKVGFSWLTFMGQLGLSLCER